MQTCGSSLGPACPRCKMEIACGVSHMPSHSRQELVDLHLRLWDARRTNPRCEDPTEYRSMSDQPLFSCFAVDLYCVYLYLKWVTLTNLGAQSRRCKVDSPNSAHHSLLVARTAVALRCRSFHNCRKDSLSAVLLGHVETNHTERDFLSLRSVTRKREETRKSEIEN